MSSWADDWGKSTGNSVTYGPIGSGGGIAQVTARTVDFGASDAPMTADQASAAKDVLQVPWALAATLVAINVPGVKNIHVSGLVLSRMYLGEDQVLGRPGPEDPEHQDQAAAPGGHPGVPLRRLG